MAQKTDFIQVPERPDFPKEEEKILDYWNKLNAFHKQLELTKNYPRFTFYDGPPFATGLPHYGHVCAGTIKDIVCRYYSQNGRHVERRFGWDCHGLPVEHEIDKALGIKHRGDILKMGIDKYNEECRSIVMKYSSEWRRIINRTGRWIDFDNDYKTMDKGFMESVWWTFKQLWDKGLVYKGCKVMPYSNTCSTVLSNFETQQNYKEVLDPAIVVTFPLVNEPDTAFVAWTTTPWTLPSNLTLVVNPQLDYVKVFDEQHKTHFILAKARLEQLYSHKHPGKYQIIKEMKGSELKGIEYVPLFQYFVDRKKDGCFKVICADYVTSTDGTGVVHAAPGFGDVDYKACLKEGLIKPDNPPVPVDSSGKFTEAVKDFAGIYVKDADKLIRKQLKQENRIIQDDQVLHNYPFCWRSDTPLIYKAIDCWFIKVTEIKENLIANNKKAYWVPSNIQEGRFNNWLEDAQDWCFSRNRFWGNPIPIWVSDDYEEIVCVGSIEELKQLSGVQEINDLHREFIDNITIPSKQGKGQLRRIEEVFDCWFESGSMPYAQQHYPFERKEIFEDIFPADFIAEGIDQTRGWFYTLNVISTAIRNDTPYKNLIVNGIVLNDKGEKMSKRKKNYPDPETEIINVFGADAMRLYLINSGLVKAQSLNFSTAGVQGVVKDVFLPWYNAYRFLIQNIQRFELIEGKAFSYDETVINGVENLMDKWIVSASETLIQFVRTEMEYYRLYTVIPQLVSYLDDLTNWYLRLNRSRMKGDFGSKDWYVSLHVLYDVLLKITILMSPYVPFITDAIYQNLRKCLKGQTEDSVHFLRIPNLKKELIHQDIETEFNNLKKVIESARSIREKQKLSVKQPVNSITIITKDESLIQSVKVLSRYIEDEINTPNVNINQEDADQYISYKATPNPKTCVKELNKLFNEHLKLLVANLTQEELKNLKQNGSVPLKVKLLEKIKGEQIQQQQQKGQKPQKGQPKEKKVYKTLEDIQKDYTIEGEAECQLLAQHLVIEEIYNPEKLKGQLYDKQPEFLLLLDPTQSDKLKKQGYAREFTNRIQKLRKKVGLQQDDQIIIFYEFPEANQFSEGIQEENESIQHQVKKPMLKSEWKSSNLKLITEQECEVEGFKFKLYITESGIVFNQGKLLAQYSQDEVNQIVNHIFQIQGDQCELQVGEKLVKLGPEEFQVLK